jgi:hypothetical protein
MHPHRQVRTLDIRRADVLWVRIASDGALASAKALRGAVAATSAIRPVNLDEHSVVDILAEHAIDGAKVRSMTIGR